MEVVIYSLEGKEVGKAQVPDALFAGEVVESLLWEMVKAQRASRRQGTHDTKTRADVRGGGAKPYKQKGTGQARQGSSRAPNHVGGGVVFGPHPRDYSYKLPRSARRAALRSALSARGNDKAVALLEAAKLDAPSTKTMAAFLGAIGAESALIIGSHEETLQRSTRNLANAKYLEMAGINVYDVLNYEKLLITQAALGELERRLAGEGPAARSAAAAA